MELNKVNLDLFAVRPHFGLLQLGRHARDRNWDVEVLSDGRGALQERRREGTVGRADDGSTFRLQVRV